MVTSSSPAFTFPYYIFFITYSEKGNKLQLESFLASLDTFYIQMLNEKPMCNSKRWNSMRKTTQMHLHLNKSKPEELDF